MNNSKSKILLAEDDLLIAMDLKLKLEEKGYEITSLVSTALEAITRVEIDKPDLLLMDVQLSGSLNGIEAANIISYKKKLPVIFLTTLGNKHLLSENKISANFNYVLKPIDTQILVTVIEETFLRIRENAEAIKSNLSQSSTFTF